MTGLHIRDALDAVATRHPGLISKFGGHAMAAGLSLPLANLETFRAAFDEEVRRHLDDDDLHGVLHSDGQLEAGDFSLELAETLRNGGPWGQAFPEPLFDGYFRVMNHRIVGEKHLKLTVQPEGSREAIDAIAFNQGEQAAACNGGPVRLAYRLDVNEFRGVRSVQLMVEYLEPQ